MLSLLCRLLPFLIGRHELHLEMVDVVLFRLRAWIDDRSTYWTLLLVTSVEGRM